MWVESFAPFSVETYEDCEGFDGFADQDYEEYADEDLEEDAEDVDEDYEEDAEDVDEDYEEDAEGDDEDYEEDAEDVDEDYEEEDAEDVDEDYEEDKDADEDYEEDEVSVASASARRCPACHTYSPRLARCLAPAFCPRYQARDPNTCQCVCKPHVNLVWNTVRRQCECAPSKYWRWDGEQCVQTRYTQCPPGYVEYGGKCQLPKNVIPIP